MSIIPQRPRDGPTLAFYSQGDFERKVEIPRHVQRMAAPGDAARLAQRNIHHTQDNKAVNEVIGAPRSNRLYNPRQHLNPLQTMKSLDFQRAVIQESSEAMNRVHKMKDYCAQNKQVEVQIAKGAGSKDDFTSKKELPASQRSSSVRTSGFMKNPPPSKPLAQNYFYITKKLNPNLAGPRPVSEKAPDARVTSGDAPQWFQVTKKPENQKTVKDAPGFDGTMTILSRNAGWITVTPQRKDRKKPIQKFGMGGDASKTSKLTPAWMQTQYGKPTHNNMMAGLPGPVVRGEGNRTFMIDKHPPPKNVFTYGHTRHNLHTSEGAETGNQQAGVVGDGFFRIYEWNENQAKQKYDKPVSGKIGSRHG